MTKAIYYSIASWKRRKKNLWWRFENELRRSYQGCEERMRQFWLSVKNWPLKFPEQSYLSVTMATSKVNGRVKCQTNCLYGKRVLSFRSKVEEVPSSLRHQDSKYPNWPKETCCLFWKRFFPDSLKNKKQRPKKQTNIKKTATSDLVWTLELIPEPDIPRPTSISLQHSTFQREEFDCQHSQRDDGKKLFLVMLWGHNNGVVSHSFARENKETQECIYGCRPACGFGGGKK